MKPAYIAFFVFSVSLLSFDEYVVRDYRSESQLAQKEMSEDLSPSRRSELNDYAFNRLMLRRSPKRAVVFIGNSIVQTAIVPEVFKQSQAKKSPREVLVFAMEGLAPATLVNALVQSSWRPELVVIDLCPTLFRLGNEVRSKAIINGISPERQNEKQRNLQSKLKGVVDERLEKFWDETFPSSLRHMKVSMHMRYIYDSMKFGYQAYRGAYAGNLTAVKMEDGSVRTKLFNKTPSYEKRFRVHKLTAAKWKIRNFRFDAQDLMDQMMRFALDLREEGTRVILANFPMDSELRAVDRQFNSMRYRVLREECAKHEGIDFVDLSADEQLTALYFYDGHHRDYENAKKATRRTAKLLEKLLK